MHDLPFKHDFQRSSFFLSSRNKISKSEYELVSIGLKNYLYAAIHYPIKPHNLRSFVCLISILLVIQSLCTASDLSITTPQSIEGCKSNVYNLSFVSGSDAIGLSALLSLPDGFHYSGNSRIVFTGTATPCEPSISGSSLRWDITKAVKSCRHVVINEWEANPKGADGGKEWIELFNPSSHDINIGGWKLTDGYYKKTVSIPAGVLISAGGYYAIYWTSGSLINSYPTNITLRDSAGNMIDSTSNVKDEEDDDRCWARLPNGRDRGEATDWSFQKSTRGSCNGENTPDIYANENLELEFNLTAGCSAAAVIALLAKFSAEGIVSSAESHPLTVLRANLSLSVIPDKFDVALGDVLAWTILLENNGNGTAYNVLVNDTLGSGLALLGTDSPGGSRNWNYASILPGEKKEIVLKAKVVSIQDYYRNLVNASWGCGSCQEIIRLCEVGRRTSIRKGPDYDRSLAVGELANYEISADLPKGARSLWINDTIPSGLSYNRSGLSLQGAALKNELTISKGDGSQQICWFLGDVGPSQNIEIEYNAQVINSPDNQDGVVLEGTKASMNWNGCQEPDMDEAGSLNIIEPDLALEKKASAPAVGVGDSLVYTVTFYHSDLSHAPAYDVNLQDLLPQGLRYSPGSMQVLSGPAASTDGSGLRWHFSCIDLSWNASRKIVLRYNATCDAKPGETVTNNATLTWTSLEGERSEERTGIGGVNGYLRRASAKANAMRLSITKRAQPDPVGVGEPLTYTFTYENEGAQAANNVTITDVLDPGVSFLSSDPAPLNAANNTWKIPKLLPDGPHSIEIKARVNDHLPNGTILENRFSIKSEVVILQ